MTIIHANPADYLAIKISKKTSLTIQMTIKALEAKIRP